MEARLAKCLEEKVVENLPNVVGVRRGRVKLSFRRLLVRLEDWYTVKVEGNGKGPLLRLEGERSRITVRLDPGGQRAEASYEGPRGWVVRARLSDLERAVLEAYKECLEATARKVKAATVEGGDYSRLLANMRFVTRLIRRSVLVKAEEVPVVDGELPTLLEEIAAEYGGEYKTIYISGTGPAVFRVLFIDGVLAGAYARRAGTEYYGEDAERILAEIMGVVKIRVYGAIALPEEVGVSEPHAH